MHRLGLRAGETGADSQVEPRHQPLEQGPEARPSEAETAGASVARLLRQLSTDERQIEPQPVQRDRTERQDDGLPVRRPARARSRPSL